MTFKDTDEERFPRVRYYQLFRFTSFKERVYLFIGIFCAVIGGILAPIINNVLGSFIQTLLDIDEEYCTTPSSVSEVKKCDIRKGDLYDKLIKITWTMVVIASCQLVCGFGFCYFLKSVSENLVFRTKQKFFESLLRQNIGWHDTQHHSRFVSRLVQNGSKIQRATGENLGLCVCLLTSAFIALINALYHGWLLTLASIILFPWIIWVSYYSTVLEEKCSEEQDLAYGDAGAVAAEALGNIRTVIAYGGEEKELQRYIDKIEGASLAGIDRGAQMAFVDGLSWFFFYFSTAVTLWLGTSLFLHGKKDGYYVGPSFNPENVLVIYLSLVMASYEFGEGISYFEMFSEGAIAASGFHNIIDRISEIDAMSESGIIPEQPLVGNIEIKDVFFSYPSRQGSEVLKGLNITVKAGQTVALVGMSGGGKSTVVQLLQRFYDPSKGSIIFDSYDIQSVNLGWFRTQIGVVRQEPVLFNGTILDNIRLAKPDATVEEITDVCKRADAHDFIKKFPETYNTVMGDRGALISGGQKQRIAIARALINNPKILILDEPTSALDIDSEHAIQATLDAARVGRTTFIVAHRLSTIKNADLIIYIKNGQVLERGTHDKLLEKKGDYYKLYQAQSSEPGKGDSAGALNVNSLEAVKSVYNIDEDTSANILLGNDNEDSPSNLNILKIWKLNMPEWKYLVVGTIVSLVLGCVQTVHGILLGNMIGNWAISDDKEVQETANKQGLMFILLGCVAGWGSFLKGTCFSTSGENLTFRLRSTIFKSMLIQDVLWFDQKQNHLGALCTRLSEDASLVQGATGVRVGNLIQGATTVLISILVALYYSIKLGILGIFFVIILNVLAFMEEIYLADEAAEDVLNVERGSMLVTQTVSEIRTIASLHIEGKFLNDYTQCLENTKRLNLKPIYLRGLIMGLSQSFTWFAYIILSFFGSYLMLTEGNLSVADIVAVSQFITFGTAVVAEAMASAPNYHRAKVASSRVLKLLAMKPTIIRNVGKRISLDDIKGKLEFFQVKFSYPNRPADPILNGITLRCQAGHHIAICGPSGCGKSTIVKLIQRFYDPTSGFLKLDDHKLTDLNVDDLRRAIGIVSQEPALFDRTIAENIAYGDNSKEVSMQEIIHAAKASDIHDFIDGLPEKYNTRVGQLGSMLSGGQKQRLAVARALVRQPRILLLDEATSALDAETEIVIQHTLDTISTNRTCVTISHHPAALRNADLIFVLDAKGKLIDKGTHSKLLAKSRFYAELTSNK